MNFGIIGTDMIGGFHAKAIAAMYTLFPTIDDKPANPADERNHGRIIAKDNRSLNLTIFAKYY